MRDYAILAAFQQLLFAAQSMAPIRLEDATKAYAHFLYGAGADRWFSYQEYIEEDPSGATSLQSMVADITDGALGILSGEAEELNAEWIVDFDMVSSRPIATGARYPYPATENWQKAIGGHQIWARGRVSASLGEASGLVHVTIDAEFNVEDMYNFNPGAADIATGTDDALNGALEESGLGHEFLHKSTLRRRIEFEVEQSQLARRVPRITNQTVTAGGSDRRSDNVPARNQRPRNRRP